MIVVSYSKQYNDGRRCDGYADETYHLETCMLRSADRGPTWDRPVRLDPAPDQCVGATKTRLNTLSDGRIVQALMVHDQPRPGKSLPKSNWFSQAFLYGSADEGHTWKNLGSLGRFTDESDVLALPSERILATIRYRRKSCRAIRPDWQHPTTSTRNTSATAASTVRWEPEPSADTAFTSTRRCWSPMTAAACGAGHDR